MVSHTQVIIVLIVAGVVFIKFGVFIIGVISELVSVIINTFKKSNR